MSYAIYYVEYLEVLEGYNDSNWISDADARKAMSQYMLTFGGGAIS